MLTPRGRTLLIAGAFTATGGVIFGNWPIVGAGALLLMLIAMSGLARAPSATRTVDRTRIERRGQFTFTMDVDTPRGLGVVEVHQALPDEFELLTGNNFHLVTLGLRRRTHRFTFTVRAPKRGEYSITPVGIRVLHPLGLAETPKAYAGEAIGLIVEPRPISARIPRDLRTRAKRPFPEGDLARMGVATNDFRELREYVSGDPPRRINWKATARRMGTGASDVPLVNETEWEGKKSVWILVDGHTRLSVGTNVEDAREHAADAALSLMELYLRRGYQVGMALVRSGDIPPLRPNTGEAQVKRARELLARLRAAEAPSIMTVLSRDAAHLHRGRPLVVLVTRLAADDADLRMAIVRMGALGRIAGRNLVPGLLLDLQPDAIVDGKSTNVTDDVAARALEAGHLQMRAAARAANVRVTSWQVDREPLRAVLVRGRIA